MPDAAIILLFITTSIALLIVPGPTTALVVARSLAGGRQVATPLVLGVGLGDLVAASVSLAGAGALLAASATAFTIVKTVGAVYLIWLGVRLFRSAPETPGSTGPIPAATGYQAFRDAFLVTVFNPKGILFFIAFVPPFIDTGKAYGTQAALFIALFVLLGMCTVAAYAIGASAMRQAIRKPRILTTMNRLGGATIAAAGVAALFARRPALLGASA